MGKCQAAWYPGKVEALFDRIADRYDRLNGILSLGWHRRWKKRLVESLGEPRFIVDIATGTGDVAGLLTDRFPGAEVWGLDPSTRMLSIAETRLPKVKFQRSASETLSLPTGAASAVTCAFGVRNFSDRAAAFREWRRVLEPGGRAGILEIHPVKSRGLTSLYWNLVPPLVGAAFGDRSAYTYLRDSAAAFLTPSALAEEMRAAGFVPIEIAPLFPCGIVHLSLFRRE